MSRPGDRKLHRCRIAGLAFAAFLAFLVSLPAAAQLPLAPASAEETPAPPWLPPDLLDLPLDWWTGFDTISPDIAEQRFDRLLETIGARIQGLDPENLVEAQNLLANIGGAIDLLLVARRAGAEPDFEPVPTQDTYDLDDVLALQARWRDLQRDSDQLELQTAQTERQVTLLGDQRESLIRQYQATDVESPRRILVGLDRIATRVGHEVARQQIENARQRLAAVRKQAGEVVRQQEYARENLAIGDVDLAQLDSDAAAARNQIIEASREVAAVQRQLLGVLSVATVKPSLEVLRKQQLTRASARAALARLRAALLDSRATWYRYRAGQLEAVYDQEEKAAGSAQLIDETLKQVDVWSATSQSTLVTTLPETNLNVAKNLELARAVAREALALIGQIRDTGDDLLLVQDILAAELVSSQSGIGRAWASFKLATGSFWSRLSDVKDYNLFDIGEAPVTLGGLFKALLILLLAYVISRFIRHLLDHATGRQQFAKSPAIYTLGRMLHYVIIIIGVFAALGSIGMDFTNFALIAGALSVGIGFGLQAIVNNFVSGLILLFEGSLRIGDYIELDSGLAGVVKEINTRATIVNSNDGVDVVVPNSELVTTKLTNWTLRETFGRLRIPFGVAYGSDKEQVKEAALLAAGDMEFILLHDRGREPQVRLVNFGDSALEFELLAWVSRPGIRRPHRVRASFLWALETRLAEAGIEIPFPQRDLHIKSGLPESASPVREPDPPPADRGRTT